MKQINFFTIVIFSLLFCTVLKAENNSSLKEYLIKKNIEESSTQIYLLNRCSAVYAYASAIILKSDPVNSKKFIEQDSNHDFLIQNLKQNINILSDQLGF